MFEPFRCEGCIYGRYHLLENSWGCLIGLQDNDEDECEENYEEHKEDEES